MDKPYRIQTQFTIPVANRPGQLETITKLLSSNGINVTGIQSQVVAQSAFVSFVTDADHNTVTTLLQTRGYTVFQTSVASVTISNKAGELDKIVNALFTAGLNVNALYGTTDPKDSYSTIVISADGPTPGVLTIDKALEKYYSTVTVNA